MNKTPTPQPKDWRTKLISLLVGMSLTKKDKLEIDRFVDQATQEAVKADRSRIGSRVGLLRQWLNERPKDILITNKDIELWLELDSKPIIKEAVERV